MKLRKRYVWFAKNSLPKYPVDVNKLCSEYGELLDESGDAASETGGVNAGPQIEEEVIERQGLDVDTPGDEKILHPCRWKDVDDVVSIHIGGILGDGVKKIVSLGCREKGERQN